MKNELDQKAEAEIRYSIRESIMISTKSGCFVIGAAFFMFFIGISMSGYKETPLIYNVIMSLIFGPSLLSFPNDPIFLENNFTLALVISAIIWAIIVFIVHRIFCKYQNSRR